MGMWVCGMLHMAIIGRGLCGKAGCGEWNLGGVILRPFVFRVFRIGR